jgi:hypothetical protein
MLEVLTHERLSWLLAAQRRPAASMVVRMAAENLEWSYRRIQGALSNLAHELARSTIAESLERHRIEPAPERSRKTTWKEARRFQLEEAPARGLCTDIAGTPRNWTASACLLEAFTQGAAASSSPSGRSSSSSGWGWQGWLRSAEQPALSCIMAPHTFRQGS